MTFNSSIRSLFGVSSLTILSKSTVMMMCSKRIFEPLKLRMRSFSKMMDLTLAKYTDHPPYQHMHKEGREALEDNFQAQSIQDTKLHNLCGAIIR